MRGQFARRAGRARLGDAVDGVVSQRARTAATRCVTLDAPRARSAAGRRARRRHARGVSPTDGPDVVLSRAAARRRSTTGSSAREQALVLLNRRGYATAVFCRQCGDDARVPELQRLADRPSRAGTAWRARCHYCNFSQAGAEDVRELRRAVPRARRVRHRAGRGEICATLFPTARIGRVDRDTVRRQGQPDRRCSTRFARGELDILVGTQMIAKGHDFPAVTLVGVISADVGLGPRRLPRRRAHVPAADAGRRPRRPRRAARARRSSRRSIPSTTASSSRAAQDYRGVLREGDRVPPRDALSAARRDGQRRRARPDVRRGDAAAPRSGGARRAADRAEGDS